MTSSVTTALLLTLLLLPSSLSCTITDANFGSLVNAFVVGGDADPDGCGSMRDWDVSRITSLNSAFKDKSGFNEDISRWNVARVTTLFQTFKGANTFDRNLSMWNTASVTEFSGVFNAAANFNGDVSRWNTAAVTYMGLMFAGATSFNGDVSEWNTESVTSMLNMFTRAESFASDVSRWNTAAVTTMTRLFWRARAFDGDVSGWNVARVASLAYAFTDCDLFNSDVSQWNVARVETFREAFSGASSFNADLSRWDTRRVTSMREAFKGATHFNADLSRWNTNSLENIYGMFEDAVNFTAGISMWNIARLTTLERAFDGARAMTPCAKRAVHEQWYGRSAVYDASTYAANWSHYPTCDLADTLREKDCGFGSVACDCSDEVVSYAMRFCTYDDCGTIPSEIGDCSGLTRLALAGHDDKSLAGTIPTEIGHLSELVALDLSGGRALNGTIPAELGALARLVSFDVSHNRLEGGIPDTFENLTRLETFVASNNVLSEPIPEGFLRLPALADVRLDRNALDGALPIVSNLIKLRSLHLDRNAFSSIGVPEFLLPESCEFVNLAHNALTGALPRFEGPSNLSYAVLSNNRFSRVRENTFANATRLVLASLASQNVPELELDAGAFRGLPSGARVSLSNNRVSRIPARCFDGLSDARVDLSSLQIERLDTDAFRGARNISIDLSGNYILRVDPSAFRDDDGGGAVLSPATNCSDDFGWEAACATLEERADTGTCDDLDTCEDVALDTFDATLTGQTPREACCAFGGGLTSGGRTFRMDAASPVTCAANSTSIRCGCSDPSARFDVVTSSCIKTCVPGYRWVDDDDNDALATVSTRAGRCARCALGRFSASGAWDTNCSLCEPGTYSDVFGSTACVACTENTLSSEPGAMACAECTFGRSSPEAASACAACDPMHQLSAHCEVPIAGILMTGGIALVLGVLICALRAHFLGIIREEEAEKKRQLSIIQRSAEDAAQMESAWRIAWTSLDLSEKIAQGGFGEVWRGTMNGTYDVAVKKMFNTENVNLREESEIRFLKRARHPKLVWFMGCGYVDDVETNNLFVVLAFMNRGDFRDFLWEEKRTEGDRNDPEPSWATRIALLKDTAEAMAYIHGVIDKVHRDLKSPNILLHKPNRGRLVGKVADFGLARSMVRGGGGSSSSSGRPSSASISKSRTSSSAAATKSATTSRSSTRRPSSAQDMFTTDSWMTCNAGSLLWMAPEVFPRRGEKFAMYSKMVDVFSFGVILWESMELRCPWTHDERFQVGAFAHKIMVAVESGDRPPIDRDEDAPPGYVALMRRCWDAAPDSRPTFTEILHLLQDMEMDVAARRLPTLSSPLPQSPRTPAASKSHCDVVPRGAVDIELGRMGTV